jgi:hypothetical protein
MNKSSTIKMEETCIFKFQEARKFCVPGNYRGIFPQERPGPAGAGVGEALDP